VKSALRLDANFHHRRHSGEGRNPIAFRQRGHFYFALPNVIGSPICAAGIVSKDKPPLPLGEGWGEGKQAAKSQTPISQGMFVCVLKSKVIPRSFPHPGPLPGGEGENTGIDSGLALGRSKLSRAEIN
jgi:hypothetical protein